VRYGLYVPNCGGYGHARDLIDLAGRAEASGWDGFFTWDLLGPENGPVADPQVTFGAIAATTTRIVFGPMVTPLGRRRPWKLAREIATLAELSRGRLILGCGVGVENDFAPFPGEARTTAERSARFVDAVELLRQLLSGSAVHWTQSERTAGVLGEAPATITTKPFLPTPEPPVRLWGGASIQREREQHRAPFARAARMFDGLFPIGSPGSRQLPISLDEFARAIDYAFDGSLPPDGFDLVAAGSSNPGHGAGEADPGRFEAEGATWWLEACPDEATPAAIAPLVDAVPPRH
jgi:alkanesulfonate monooxygenase SsuD/methylene tetrahydromethanopterin reductase-like flavin-dependent oxidoreductase (luciferase family)